MTEPTTEPAITEDDSRPSRGPKRFTTAEVEQQKVRILALWMAGQTFELIAATVSAELGVSISLATAQRRKEEALDDYRPHADVSYYRSVQIAEMDIARRKLRQAMTVWSPMMNIPTGERDENGKLVLDAAGNPVTRQIPNDVSNLTQAAAAMARLHAQESKLLGIDRAPLPSEELEELTDEQLLELAFKWASEHPDAGDVVAGDPTEEE